MPATRAHRTPGLLASICALSCFLLPGPTSGGDAVLATPPPLLSIAASAAREQAAGRRLALPLELTTQWGAQSAARWVNRRDARLLVVAGPADAQADEQLCVAPREFLRFAGLDEPSKPDAVARTATAEVVGAGSALLGRRGPGSYWAQACFALEFDDVSVGRQCDCVSPHGAPVHVTVPDGPLRPPQSAGSPRRVFVVTGASRGIGFEVARKLLVADDNDVVVITATTGAAAADAAERLAEAASLPDVPEDSDTRLVAAVLDLANVLSLEAFVAELKAGVGRVDVLINNAAVLKREWDEVSLFESVGTNAYGPARLAFELARQGLMGTSGGIPCEINGEVVDSGVGASHLLCPVNASVINVSSDLGRRNQFSQEALDVVAGVTEPLGYMSHVNWRAMQGAMDATGFAPAYKVSKLCMNGATRLLARMLAPLGVAVNAVHPGWVKTRMGGDNAPLKPEEGAANVLRAPMLRETVDDRRTGMFFDSDGKPFAW